MKTLDYKKVLSIVIMLILSLSAVFAVCSNDTAKAVIQPYQGEVYPTWCYISLAAPVEGVGQSCTIVFWCDANPPTAIGQYGDRWTFMVNVVKPDGTNETLGPFTSDPVGTGYTTFTPTTTGQYEFQAIFERHVLDGGASRGLVSPAGVGFWPSGSPYYFFNTTSMQFQYLNPVGDVFLGSMSNPQNLTVTTTQIPAYPETPLPNDYWSYPVYDTNRIWSQTILGEWYNAAELNQFGNSGRFNPYTTGPSSAHILWTYPYWSGGEAGGVATLGAGGTAVSYYSGQSYEAYGSQPYMVLNGIAYVSQETDPRQGFYEINLHTGKEVYYANSTGPVVGAGGPFASSGSRPDGIPAFGEVLDMETPNQHGTIDYYWVTSNVNASTWEMYDAFTNSYICTIDNLPTWMAPAFIFAAPSAKQSYGNDGSILEFAINDLAPPGAPPKLYLQCWNTTQCILAPEMIADMGYEPILGQAAPAHPVGTGSNTYWMWRPEFNVTFNGALGYSINVSIPSSICYQSMSMFGPSPTMQQIIPDHEVWGIYPGSNNGSVVVPGQVWGISLARATIGQVLTEFNFTPPAGLGDAAAQNQMFQEHDTTYAGTGIFGGNGMDANASLFWFDNTMLREWYVYSLTTGKELWSTTPGPQWDFYGMGPAVIYNNMFIDTGGWSGVVTAFNAQTGKFLWNWTAPSVGQGETPYQYTPVSDFGWGGLTGDGQLYLYSGEHSVNNPIRRDGMIWDLNTTTGKLIWSITCWPSGAPILADQSLLVLDDHDNQIYDFGRGPSATTVQTPLAGVAQGSSLVIQGTVMDVSPGTTQSAIYYRFPNGVPCVADASESAWMEYVYHQRPMPTNATGVPVDITLIDPNHNIVNLPATTSDASGHFSVAVSTNTLAAGTGMYTVIASFPGTNAYYPSSAESSFVVTSAPATPPPTAPPVTGLASTGSLELGIAAVIIVIVVIGIVLAVLTVRKRP